MSFECNPEISMTNAKFCLLIITLAATINSNISQSRTSARPPPPNSNSLGTIQLTRQEIVAISFTEGWFFCSLSLLSVEGCFLDGVVGGRGKHCGGSCGRVGVQSGLSHLETDWLQLHPNRPHELPNYRLKAQLRDFGLDSFKYIYELL